MADANSFTLDAAAWVDPRQWAAAPEALRRRYLARVGELATRRKRWEQARRLDARGKALLPRLDPRADGANGPPLSPHRAESRTAKWLRSSVGLKAGSVTCWWSHGWGKVLGYHRAGIRSRVGLRRRDVIGLTPAGEKKVRDEARSSWRALTGQARAGRRPAPPPRLPYPVPRGVAVTIGPPASVKIPRGKLRLILNP